MRLMTGKGSHNERFNSTDHVSVKVTAFHNAKAISALCLDLAAAIG